MFLLSPIYRLVKYRFFYNFFISFFVSKSDVNRFEYVDWSLGSTISLLERKKRFRLRSILWLIRNALRRKNINLVNSQYCENTSNSSSYPFLIATDPVLSIIIEADIGYIDIDKCLSSIYNSISDNLKLDIIIIDNNPVETYHDFERRFPNVCRMHVTDGSDSLPERRNKAVSAAKGKYILFMNCSVTARAGWLDALLRFIDSHDNAVICGSKIIYRPDDCYLIHDVGYSLATPDSPTPLGHNELTFSFEYSHVKEVDFVSSSSMLIKRSFWNSCKGYDDAFSSIIYADADLCYCARQMGCSIYCVPESVVIANKDENHDRSSYDNHVDSIRLGKKYQKNDHATTTQNIYSSCDKKNTGKTVVVFDSKIPSYDTNAGARSTDQYVDLLLSSGFTVAFIALSKSGEKELRYYQSKGIETISGTISEYLWKDWIKDHSDKIDYFFINRPHIADQVIPFVKRHTKAKIIYQGHDLHFLRLQRDYDLSGNIDTLKESMEMKKIEEKVLDNSDFSFYFSEDEVNIIRKEFGTTKISTTPLFFYDTFFENLYKPSFREHLLFVGGFAHKPNCDAMNFFIDECFPVILEKNPNIKLFIVGTRASDELLSKATDHIVFTGYLSDAEIIDLYKKVRLVVVPLRYGAGIKGKIIESMYYHVPVITTTIGAEGIPFASDSMKVVEDIDAFGISTASLYGNFEQLESINKNAAKTISTFFSKEVAEKSFLSQFIMN